MKGLVATFKALSDPTRLRIVLLLLQRDLCVCELISILGLEQSRVSHQLRILRGAGLVKDIRDGKWIIYHVPTPVRRGLDPFLREQGLAGAEEEDAFAGDLKRLGPCLLKSPRRQQAARTERAARSEARSWG